jgi:hypothetical protein
MASVIVLMVPKTAAYAGPTYGTYAPYMKCPGWHGLFPHPSDCSSFLNCANGKAYVQPCPYGTHFNAYKLVCDWPYNAHCKAHKW